MNSLLFWFGLLQKATKFSSIWVFETYANSIILWYNFFCNLVSRLNPLNMIVLLYNEYWSVRWYLALKDFFFRNVALCVIDHLKHYSSKLHVCSTIFNIFPNRSRLGRIFSLVKPKFHRKTWKNHFEKMIFKIIMLKNSIIMPNLFLNLISCRLHSTNCIRKLCSFI